MKILAPQQSELEELAGEKKYRAMVTESKYIDFFNHMPCLDMVKNLPPLN